MYRCPVCGYDQLRFPPDDSTICPSCGTQFGYSDANTSYEQLRAEWLLNGAHWQSNVIHPPQNWNANSQLARLNQELVTASQVHISGVIVQPGQARIRSRRIVLFGTIADAVSYNQQSVHA